MANLPPGPERAEELLNKILTEKVKLSGQGKERKLKLEN